MTKLTKEEVLKIYNHVFHYHFQQPHQINNILTVTSEIQNTYQTKNTDLEKDAARYRYLRSRDSRVDVCDQCGYDGLHLRTGHLLDCHIDDAMKESK